MIKGNKSYTYFKNLRSVNFNLKALVDILRLLNCKEFLVFFDIDESNLKCLDVFKDYQAYYDNLCIISSSQNETYDKLIRKMNYLNPKKLIQNDEIYFMIDYNYSEMYVAFYFNIRNYNLTYVKNKIDNLF